MIADRGMRAKTFLPMALLSLASEIVAAGFMWAPQNTPTTNTLFSVHHSPLTSNGPNTAYAVGASGIILKNSTGTWTLQNSGTTADLRSVFFVSADTGYTVGGSIGSTERSVILKTTNGGLNWTPQNGNVPRVLRAVFFLNRNFGFAAGAGGTIIKTINGGATWVAQNSGTTATLNGLQFIDASTGYAVGDGGTLLKTTDAGVSWAPQNSGTSQPVNSVYFPDPDTGYVVGGGGFTGSTTNGGVLWTVRIGANFYDWNSVHGLYLTVFSVREHYRFTAGNSIIAGGGFIPPNPPTTFYSLHFPTGSSGFDGYAVGSNGAIYESSWSTGIAPKNPGPVLLRPGKTNLFFDARGRLRLKLFENPRDPEGHFPTRLFVGAP